MDLSWPARLVAELSPAYFRLLVVACAIVGLGLFAFGFSRLRRGRMLEDLPTSKVRSAAQGYVELTGHARFLPGPEIVSPLSGRRCCWWEYRVERREWRRTEYGPYRAWVTIDEARSDELFVLADDTGECVVDPTEADVIPGKRRRWRGYHPRPRTFPDRTPWFAIGPYRYTERLVAFGDWLYAVGTFASQTALRDDEERRDVGELLAEWKRNPRELVRRFDADGDGRIDQKEWEAARRAALAEVRALQTDHVVQTDLHVLARPADGRPFILSTQPEEALADRYRSAGLASIASGIALGAVAVFGWLVRGWPPSP